MTLAQVRAWARADGSPGAAERSQPVTGVSTDTRTLMAGQVFLALGGERFDGHDHVGSALDRGACAAVVRRDRASSMRDRRGALLAVDSPLLALGRLARAYRRRFEIPVVAVTGSAGKTTAKEMIAAALERRYRVLKTPESENNEIGVPRALLGLSPDHGAAVVELAARKPGDIAYLCRIVQPTVGVLLNIGTAHLEFFESVERVAKAKGELLDFIVDESCVALVNADDCVIAREAKRTKGRLLGFGLTRESHFSGEGLVLDQEGCGHFSLQNTPFHLRIPGRHNALNALAAAGAATQCGVALAEVAAALSQFEPVAMRSEILRKRGIRVINDCYNANPGSMLAALDLVAEIPVRGRRIAVLGDMLELGAQSVELHEQLGRHAALRVDVVLGFGPLSANTVRAAREAGMGARVHHFGDRDDVIQYLRGEAHDGDLVLVKGSRGMALESVVEGL